MDSEATRVRNDENAEIDICFDAPKKVRLDGTK